MNETTTRIFAVLGVILGIFSTSHGSADEPNFIYHRIVLVLLIVTLSLLATSDARIIPGNRNRSI